MNFPKPLQWTAARNGAFFGTSFCRWRDRRLIVVALFTFMGAWNDFLGPLVYIQHPSQYTLALGLQTFQSQHGGTQWNLLMAASLLVIAPIIVLFFLAQKTFIEGIATTGMKG